MYTTDNGIDNILMTGNNPIPHYGKAGMSNENNTLNKTSTENRNIFQNPNSLSYGYGFLPTSDSLNVIPDNCNGRNPQLTDKVPFSHNGNGGVSYGNIPLTRTSVTNGNRNSVHNTNSQPTGITPSPNSNIRPTESNLNKMVVFSDDEVQSTDNINSSHHGSTKMANGNRTLTKATVSSVN